MCFRKLGFCVAFLLSLLMYSVPSGALFAQRPAKHSYRPAYGNHVFPKKASQIPNRGRPVVKQGPQSSKRVSRAPQQQFNHHSFYPSRSLAGNGRRRTYSVGPSFIGRGFNTPYYYDSYLYGNRGVVLGAPYYQPLYATYGTYLSVGGPVGGAGPVGSSVAAEAFQRLANGQAIVPGQSDPNSDLEAENLRLQIELERARQQLALQGQDPLPVQQALKPAIADDDDANLNAKVVNLLDLAAVIETNQLAKASQLKAERAFRSGQYGKAARFASLAVSLDESNGKLRLFVSQSHFANGEYREAAETLAAAISLLPSDDLGFVIENFKLFYGQDDFVAQTRALSEHLQQSPQDGAAWMLRGYQYGALGYPDAAKADLDQARSLGVFQQSIEALETRFASGK